MRNKDRNVALIHLFSFLICSIDRRQFLIQLSTVPVTVCIGSGDTEEEARKEAAVNTLYHVKLLSK